MLLPVGGMTLSTGKFCSACNKGKVVYEYVLKYSVTALYIPCMHVFRAHHTLYLLLLCKCRKSTPLLHLLHQLPRGFARETKITVRYTLVSCDKLI